MDWLTPTGGIIITTDGGKYTILPSGRGQYKGYIKFSDNKICFLNLYGPYKDESEEFLKLNSPNQSFTKEVEKPKESFIYFHFTSYLFYELTILKELANFDFFKKKFINPLGKEGYIYVTSDFGIDLSSMTPIFFNNYKFVDITSSNLKTVFIFVGLDNDILDLGDYSYAKRIETIIATVNCCKYKLCFIIVKKDDVLYTKDYTKMIEKAFESIKTPILIIETVVTEHGHYTSSSFSTAGNKELQKLKEFLDKEYKIPKKGIIPNPYAVFPVAQFKGLSDAPKKEFFLYVTIGVPSKHEYHRIRELRKLDWFKKMFVNKRDEVNTFQGCLSIDVMAKRSAYKGIFGDLANPLYKTDDTFNYDTLFVFVTRNDAILGTSVTGQLIVLKRLLNKNQGIKVCIVVLHPEHTNQWGGPILPMKRSWFEDNRGGKFKNRVRIITCLVGKTPSAPSSFGVAGDKEVERLRDFIDEVKKPPQELKKRIKKLNNQPIRLTQKSKTGPKRESAFTLDRGTNQGQHVLVAFDNQEEICVHAFDYVKKEIPYFNYTQNQDSKKQFKFLFYFTFQSIHRVVLTKKILDTVKTKTNNVVLFVVSAVRNIKQTTMDLGGFYGLKESDFGFHMAFMKNVFQDTANNKVGWKKLLEYLSKHSNKPFNV